MSQDQLLNEEKNKKNDGEKEHSLVEIECQNTSESEDDNLEKITEPQRFC